MKSDLTSGYCRTHLRYRFGTPQSQALYGEYLFHNFALAMIF